MADQANNASSPSRAQQSSLPNGYIPRNPSLGHGLLSSSSTASPGRLESFRLPRDLSLGGTSPSMAPKPKRSKFEPVIPKNKPKTSNTPRPSTSANVEVPKKKPKKEGGNRRERGRGGFQGRGRGRGAGIIQTVGSVFGEGLHELPIHRFKERYEAKSSYKKIDMGPKPFYKEERDSGRTNKPGEENDDDRVIVDMKRSDFIDDPGKKPQRGDATPMCVPFRKHAWSIKQEDLKQEVKTENQASRPIVVNGVTIKLEVKDEVKEETMELEQEEPVDVKPQLPTPEDLMPQDLTAEDILLRSMSSDMFLLQLPDCLPGHVEADPDSKPGASSQQDSSSSTSRRSVPCTLADLGEGLLGYVEIMASGRTRLNIGNDRVLYLEVGTPTPTRQEVVSVEVDEQARQGTMKVLGDVSSRLICTPDWQTELRKIKSNKNS